MWMYVRTHQPETHSFCVYSCVFLPWWCTIQWICYGIHPVFRACQNFWMNNFWMKLVDEQYHNLLIVHQVLRVYTCSSHFALLMHVVSWPRSSIPVRIQAVVATVFKIITTSTPADIHSDMHTHKVNQLFIQQLHQDICSSCDWFSYRGRRRESQTQWSFISEF